MTNNVKQEYQDALGQRFGAVYHGLWSNWAWALMRLQEFRELFSDATRVELLNAITGGEFFGDIQDLLWDDLILRVCRLTDNSKRTLTIWRLPSFCKDDPTLQKELQKRVQLASDAAKLPRRWRNQRIAHSDLTQVTTPDSQSLPHTNLQQVAAVLDGVHGAINAISRHLLNREIPNHVTVPPRAGAFIAYTRQLVEAVQYIDSLIDPNGNSPITDIDVAGNFLQKVGGKIQNEHVMQIIELREATQRFRHVPRQHDRRLHISGGAGV